MQLRKGQDLFFIAIGHSAQVMNWQLERFVLCWWQPKSTGTVWAVGVHVWVVLCANSQPFCPGLGKGDEGRSHPELLVPVMKDVQQDVPISTVPSQVPSGVWGHWPCSVSGVGWVVGMPHSGPVCRSCLISFSTPTAAQGGSYWSLAEGTSAEQGLDRDAAQLAEVAVQPRLSAITPGKRPLFPDDAVEKGLCLCTITPELNVLPIVFPLHCLHLLAFIYIQVSIKSWFEVGSFLSCLFCYL